MANYTSQQLVDRFEEYLKLRKWTPYHFRTWKIIEFLYWLDTGIMLPEITRTDMKKSQIEVQRIIDTLKPDLSPGEADQLEVKRTT